MREMLEPMFGEWGAQALQFLITAAIVIALLALAYWLVRRYSMGGIGRHSRAKVPRLTIVDAMPVDGRRRLVLVRRDNVEHLILIGGPSDVVVEQTIVRQRRPRPATDPGEIQVASAEPEAMSAPTESPPVAYTQPQLRAPTPPPPPPPEPMPPTASVAHASGMNGSQPAPERNFSFRRATPTAPPPPAAAPIAPPRMAHAPEPAPSAARYIDIQRPTRIESPALASPEPEPDPLFPDLPTAEAGPLDPEPGDGMLVNGAAAEQRSPREPSPFAKPKASDEDTSAKVSDLEREMARLLGEITQKRPS